MKVLLYTEFEKQLEKSGLGKAIRHQICALERNGIPYTTDPHEDYDIVHINFYGLGSYRMAKAARRKGKKVVYHAHSTEEDFRNSFRGSNFFAPFFKWWICRCYRLGDHIITPTPYSKRILESYGLSGISAISNGIDTDFFKKNEADGRAFREKYGYSATDKVVMGIGLYLERKGILDFVQFAKDMPDVKFIWFGYTAPHLIPAEIREAVSTELPNLCFAGYVEPTVIRAALSGADLYVFPTHEETEGIPIMEACACRQRAIVRDIPVFDGWLTDGVNVYKAKDNAAFETKIREVLDGRLPDLTDAAYEVALNCDAEKVGRELIDVYETVMAEQETENAHKFFKKKSLG